MRRFSAILKRGAALVLALVLVLSMGVTAGAAETKSGTCGDDLTWSFDSATGTLTIEGTGAMYDYDNNNVTRRTPWYGYRSSIKTVLLPEGMTRLGNDAFNGCGGINELSFPDSLVTIGTYAFCYCYALTTVEMGAGVETIGNGAFYDCDALKTITLGSAVKTIGSSAFGACYTLTHVVYAGTEQQWAEVVVGGDALPSIGVFFGSDVMSGTCGDDLQWELDGKTGELVITGSGAMDDYDNDYAVKHVPWFYQRDAIKTVTLPDGLTGLGKDSFENCVRLTRCDLPQGLTEIPAYAFYNCYNLKEVVLPASVETIGTYAFYNCDGIKELSFPDCVETIGSHAFESCSALTTVKIGDGVKTIGSCAFRNCDALTTVEMGAGVETIGNDAFEYCDALKTITLGSAVKTIGSSAFYSCGSLYAVTIPVSVTSIGSSAFSDCAKLADVYYGGTEAQWGKISIYSGNEALTYAILHTVCDGAEVEAAYENNGDGTHTQTQTCSLCDGVLSTVVQKCKDGDGDDKCDLCGGDAACYHSKTTVTYSPAGDRTHKATGVCAACGAVMFETTAACSDKNADERCDLCGGDLICAHERTETSYEIGAGESHELVTICSDCGSELRRTEETCVDKDSNKKCDLCGGDLVCKHATTVISCEPNGDKTHDTVTTCTACGEEVARKTGNCMDRGEDTFCDLCGGQMGCDHANTETTYVVSRNRTHYAVVTCTDCGKECSRTSESCADTDSNGACDRCGSTGTETGTCGDDLTWIFDYASGTLSIEGTGAMYDYDNNYVTKRTPWYDYRNSIKTVLLPEGLTKLGSYAFHTCYNLANCDLPQSLTSIGSYAFYDCYRLKEIAIPDCVKAIGNYAFGSCDALTTVKIGDGVKTIGNYAFCHCDALTTVEMGAGVETIGNDAFFDCDALKTITLGSAVKTIGRAAFNSCDRLYAVTIPVSVTSIDSSAFSGCANLADVYYGGTEAQWGKIYISSGNTALTYATLHTVCDGAEVEAAYENNGDGTHTQTQTCSLCDGVLSTVVQKCKDGDGDDKCDLCGGDAVCYHSKVNTHYTPAGDRTHKVTGVCADCGAEQFTATAACSDKNKDQKCDQCGADLTCKHDQSETDCEPNGNSTHDVVTTCAACGIELDRATEPCENNGNGKCSHCGYVFPCDHETTATTYTPNGDGTHTVKVLCTCGTTVREAVEACADENEDEICDRCGSDRQCAHGAAAISYIPAGDRTHHVEAKCKYCGKVVVRNTYACVDQNMDNACDRCGQVMECTHGQWVRAYTPLEDGANHKVSYNCGGCGEEQHVLMEAEACTAVDGVCTLCGGTVAAPEEPEVPEVLLQFTGSNMTLGNELEVNFLIETSALDAEKEYTAVITHSGKEAAAMAECTWGMMGAYAKISYRVCAKQMADELQIVLKDETGKVCSECYVTSVRDYAARALQSETVTDAVKTMMVDMLNYGASAQKVFGYNTEDPATRDLTEEQKALATGEVRSANDQLKGAKYVGANLSLEDRIVLNMYFNGFEHKEVGEMYAKVSFTDFNGVERAIKVSGSEFRWNAPGVYGVVVDDIVLADAYQRVLVTVYNGSGSIHGFGQDSVASYVNRAQKADTDGLYENILRFATSACAYLSDK